MTTPVAGLRRMIARDPEEGNRVGSPLELFFDLVFVIAVSFSSSGLHGLEASGHPWAGLGSYLMVFFAIWWAWMNFTWFASAFDTDDWLYRLLTLLQMAGVLVLAAGVDAAMRDSDFTVVTAGYVIMRLAMVAQWARAAASCGPGSLRRTTVRYAVGIICVQVLWVGRLALPESWGLVSFLVLVACEIAVPVQAERSRATPWHPDHIAERYGAFTLILLGESLLASASAVTDALAEAEHVAPLLSVAACGLVLAAGMWWIYFHQEHGERVAEPGDAFAFGYLHYVLFAAAGAFSAGVEIAIDQDTSGTGLGAAMAAATLTLPVGLFVVLAWWLTLSHRLPRAASAGVVAGGVLIVVSAVVPFSLVIAAALMVGIVVLLEVVQARGLTR
jgi:low temperature requirement protein LtrA